MKLPDFAGSFGIRIKKGSQTDDFWQQAGRHEGLLYRAAFQYTGNRFDAEDLVQETYLAAFRNRHQLRDPRKIKSWLFVILRNNFLKWAGRRHRGSEQEYDERTDDDFIDRLEIFAARDDALRTLERKATAESVHQRLKALTEPYRTVLILYYLKEFSYQEIADMLEIPIGTVMSRLARGKQRLKKAFMQDAARADSRSKKVIPLARKG